MDVLIINPTEVVFEGEAESVIMPGEEGVFEVLSFHKPFLSRLISGAIAVDDKRFPIRRGVVKVNKNMVTAIIEEP